MHVPHHESTALDARGLSKRFGEQEALRDVDLVVRRGELHGLLGPNGAGKTTLLRLLLGLIRPDAGTVRVLGRDRVVDGGLPDGVAGFVEMPTFYPYMSGRANLDLLRTLDKSGGSVETVLERTGLLPDAPRRVSTYSTGMRQRLGIAAALLRDPQLLFLDEPTTALDAAAACEMRQVVNTLAARGTAVVFSSHDMAEVEELCSTITVLNHGRVVFSGTIEALRALAPATMYLLKTSHDAAARSIAARCAGVSVEATAEGLHVRADRDALDRYVIALGSSGVAVRALEPRVRSLESLFLDLTAAAA